MERLGALAFALVLFLAAPGCGQSGWDVGQRNFGPINPCALPYAPTLSGTGPLPSCFVTPIAPLNPVTQTGGTMVTADIILPPETVAGIAVMTGAGHPAAFSQFATLTTDVSSGVDGVCALDLSGNGYCYVVDSIASGLIVLTAANQTDTLSLSCPPPHLGDQIEISITSSNLITCTNVTTPGSGPISVTDTTYLVGTLYPAVLVEYGNPLSNPISTTP